MSLFVTVYTGDTKRCMNRSSFGVSGYIRCSSSVKAHTSLFKAQ